MPFLKIIIVAIEIKYSIGYVCNMLPTVADLMSSICI